MKQIILWFSKTKLYKHLLTNVIPFVRFTTKLNPIRGDRYHEGYNILKPGHIICTVDKHKLTSILVPGTTSHAAICIGKRPTGFEIAEMTHKDFTYSDFFDICKESSRVFILECMDWSDEYIAEVIDAVNSLKDAKYDQEFLLGVEALYCSELIYMADQIAAYRLGVLPKLQVDLSDLVGLGRPYLSPDGLLFAKNVICRWDSDNKFEHYTGESLELSLEKQ